MFANPKHAATALFLAATVTVSAGSTQSKPGAVDWPDFVGSTIWTADTQPGWVPGTGAVLDFAADSSGVSYESLSPFSDLSDPATVPETFIWSVAGSSLEILYDDFATETFANVSYPFQEFADEYGFDQSVVDFLNLAFENGEFNPPAGQVQLTDRTVSTTNTLDSETMGRGRVSTVQRTEYSIDEVLTSLNWPGELPRGVVFSTSESLVYLPVAITNGLQNPPGLGDTWAVPHRYEPLDPRVIEPSPPGWFIDVFTLDPLGETSDGVLSQRGFAWSVTTDGLVLDSGAERYTHTPIETDGSNYLALTTYSVNGEVQLRGAGWIARSDGMGATLVDDLVQPIPLYWQAGINLWRAASNGEDGRLLPSQVFGYSLAEDSSSFRIFSGSDNCLADEFDPCFQAENEIFDWSWSAAGDTIVRDLNLPEFFPIRSRTWTVLRYQPGGRATVFEWAVWERPTVPASFVIRPRLNTLELVDLSTWPEQWADADGFYPDDDSDGDGIADAADSCVQLASTDLRDSDGDGLGNVCDSDLNQDCQVNFVDLGILRSVFFTTPENPGWNPSADFNGDGTVNFVDLGVMRSQFFTPPGPSGVPNLCE